jgi:large subunit ribosomal protein L17
MLTNLIKFGRITTTNKKAKAVKAYADHFFARLVGYGTDKDGTRNAIAYIKSVVWTEEDGKKALLELAPKYAASNHVGGYTQMFKLGFRKGDSAEKIMITLL